jgi:hypothetical protein
MPDHEPIIYVNGKLTTPAKLAAEQKEAGEVDLKTLSPGDTVTARTQNSVYEIEIVDPAECEVLIRGGSRFPVPTKVFINGSTWGGSMLLMNKIGVGMRIEMYRPEVMKPLLSSSVESFTIKRKGV